jgi:hypothetical protein
MKQGNTSIISALFLPGAALLQFMLLVISMITSFSFPVEAEAQPRWSIYLIALVLLGIAVVGAYQLRTQRGTTPFSQRVAVLLGLSLGIVSAILLYLPGFGLGLYWLTLVLYWLIFMPTTILSLPPFVVPLSIAFYAVFATIYVICFFLVARRSGSVKQGLWSSVQAVMATFLGVSLTFSFIDIAAYFIFHMGSGLFGPSSIPGFSRLVNYIASYQRIVDGMALWLLAPVILGLLVTLVCSFFFSRHASHRPIRVQTN